jgi:ankyrin repeat protein
MASYDNAEELALREVTAALSRGGSPHDVVESVYGLTRMHVAARSGHTKVLSFLIEKGGNVNVPNEGGRGAGGESPLHWASTAEVVDLLIAKGADPASPGAAGQTPLASAASRNRPAAVKALVRHGADVNARDPLFGASVLMSACTGLVVDYGDPALNRYDDRIAIIEFLVSKGAEVNAQRDDGETALHIVAKYEARFVELLLKLGADPSIKDDKGKKPIDWSRELHQDKITAILEKVTNN